MNNISISDNYPNLQGKTVLIKNQEGENLKGKCDGYFQLNPKAKDLGYYSIKVEGKRARLVRHYREFVVLNFLQSLVF